MSTKSTGCFRGGKNDSSRSSAEGRAGAELPRWPRPRTFGTLPTVAFHIFAAPLPPFEDDVGCSGSLELSAAYTELPEREE